jgi:hypothetical protein
MFGFQISDLKFQIVEAGHATPAETTDIFGSITGLGGPSETNVKLWAATSDLPDSPNRDD